VSTPDLPDDDLIDPGPAAPRGRGRSRRPRFELEFGDFEPADRTGPGDEGTYVTDGPPARPATDEDDDTFEPVEPLTRRRRRRGERVPPPSDTSGTYDAPLADRDRRVRERVARAERRSGGSDDAVAGEIEALERFEDAIESVRTPSARMTGASEFTQRLLVAIPAGIFAIFLVAQGGPVFVVGVLAFALIGVWELTRMFAKAHPSLVAGGLGVTALIVAAALGGREAMLTALAAMIPIVFLSVALSRPPGGAPGVSVTLLGIVWIGVALGHAVLLRDGDHGGGIVINVLLGTFLGDTGAYLGGRMFGNVKLAPRISPNKTVEGLLIGIVTAVATVWFAGLYQDWLSGTDALILGLAVAIAAPLGDLFESYLKRDAGTKDAGTLFGPHGGVLDRLDAAMFAIVAGYYVWLALGGL